MRQLVGNVLATLSVGSVTFVGCPDCSSGGLVSSVLVALGVLHLSLLGTSCSRSEGGRFPAVLQIRSSLVAVVLTVAGVRGQMVAVLVPSSRF